MTGRNGAGKSTFSAALCGLLRQARGVYCRDGRKLTKRQRVRNSYMVMQEVNHQLFADSVRAELLLGVRHPDLEKFEQILEMLHLTGLETRHPMTLSGGQKQRVAIAAAMFCGKTVLVLDEPTSGLDYTHMVQTGYLLEQLKRAGCLILVVTHDREFVVRCCDSVLHIDDGRVDACFPLDLDGYERLRVLMDT